MARLAVAASFAWLIPFWIDRPLAAGDTPWLLDGTDALRGCLQDGDLVACRFSRHTITAFGGMSPIGPWPLEQYVPDYLVTSLGVSAHPDRVRILVVVGIAALVAALTLSWLVFTRVGQRAWFWGFLALVLGGPMVAYGNTSWGEPLAAGLLVCFVAAALLPASPPVVALAAFGACLTKETAYPFVVALGLLGLVLARRRTGMPIRRHVVWGAGGLVVGIVAASLFNVIRFGSVLNTNQLQSEFHTPGIGRKLEFAAGLLVSPSGGILVFWASAAVLLSLACLLPLARRRELDPRPALVLLATVVALIFGLASWWTPFGWAAWGPRLTLPWVLPLVLIALAAYGEPLGELARRLLEAPWRLALVAAVTVLLALPHVGFLASPDATTHRFFSATDTHCQGPSSGVGSPTYYACLREQMWTRHPMLLDALPGLKTKAGVLSGLAVALGVLGSLFLLREELRPRERRSNLRA